MIPPGFVQELLTRVDIAEVIGRQVQLKRSGASLVGLCPFHGEKTPSFNVIPSKQFYHCFGCGANGDAIRFLTEHHGMSFVDAVHDLAQQVGMQVPEDDASPEARAEAVRQRERQATLSDVLSRAAAHYRKQLKASPRAIEYLKGRGLSGDIAGRFGLGYAPDSWRGLASVYPSYDDPLLAEAGLVVVVQGDDETDLKETPGRSQVSLTPSGSPTQSGRSGAIQKRYDRFRDRIMFPIRNVKGEVIAFGARVLDRGEPKYLNSPETSLFVKGRELYGLYEARVAIREQGYALVTEGYMDVVALAQLGLPNAVATLGTACTADHLQKLVRFTDQVVFSFDGDAAGRRAAGRALEAALPHAADTRSFRFLFLPPEHDPDSYVREHGREAFQRCVEAAVPLSRQLVDHAREGCDLATAEGRARMLAVARPLWSALPEGALRRQLLADLAGHGGLPLEELAALWQVGGSGLRRPAPPASGRGPLGQRPPIASRMPPRKPEDRVIQMLLAHADWWDTLSAQDQELLHGLPTPHGALVAWLERDLAEHGPRPWAALRHALQEDPAQAEARASIQDLLAGIDEHDVTPADLRRTLDMLLLHHLGARTAALLAEVDRDPGAVQRYQEHYREWKIVKERLTAASD